MNKRGIVLMVGCLMLIGLGTACRQYQKPVYDEVESYQSAFVIPIEGNTTNQDAFASAELLKSKKVPAKRIEIPTRWDKQGRNFLGLFDINGEWKKTMMVLKVDRTPISKQFTPDVNTGSSVKNQGLFAESRDSIGVSSGFAITAVVLEEDAHLFLYRFKGDSLSTVMDSQIFNSIQSIYTEICNKYDLKDLRARKQEITDRMREVVIPMYKEWGITINPDMGLIGGFKYEDKEIQEAINKVFVNQTMQAANEALRDSQQAKNEQELSAKKNVAAMFLVEKEAEAQGIAVVAKAITDAGEMYIRNKQLEVMANAIQKWNGAPPTVLGGGGGMPMMFNMPLPEAPTK